MEQRGLIARERRGREIVVLPHRRGHRGAARGDRARARIRIPSMPPEGGWTLVTFSLPEDLRSLRQPPPSALTWEGFAPLRDGLWLAPGEIDLARRWKRCGRDLPAGRHPRVPRPRAPRLPDGRQRASRPGTSTRSAASTSPSSRRGASPTDESPSSARRPARCSSPTGWLSCAPIRGFQDILWMPHGPPSDRSRSTGLGVARSRAPPRAEFDALSGHVGSQSAECVGVPALTASARLEHEPVSADQRPHRPAGRRAPRPRGSGARPTRR